MVMSPSSQEASAAPGGVGRQAHPRNTHVLHQRAPSRAPTDTIRTPTGTIWTATDTHRRDSRPADILRPVAGRPDRRPVAAAVAVAGLPGPRLRHPAHQPVE